MPWKAFGVRARTHPFRLESVGTCCVESFEPRKQNLTKQRPKARKSGDCETSKATGTRGHATGIMSCHICWRQISSDVTLLPVQWCFPSGWSVSVARFCCNGFNVVSPQELSKTWSQYVYQYHSVLHHMCTSYDYIHIYITLYYIISYYMKSYYIILCYMTLYYYIILYYILFYYIMLCYVMLYFTILYDIMIWY